MNEVEIVNHLQNIQRGKLGKVKRDRLQLKLKKMLTQYLRRGYQIPLCLGWYTALMLEDLNAKGNEFLEVRDKAYLPGNRAEATFALAWSYDHLYSLEENERHRKYGSADIYIILDKHFSVSSRTVNTAVKRYGDLVQALNNREFDPETANPTFARYAIEQVYIYGDATQDDVYFEAILEDNTLIQYFRDGHFRALNPPRGRGTQSTTKYASYEKLYRPKKRDTRITYHHKIV